ncbi:hypothetical protein [Cetobacterium sp.]|uniref:hypothetical protein n=1 Tax=Cetobacterium sp. TaxID=2071632 RepID=UPI003F3D6380
MEERSICNNCSKQFATAFAINFGCLQTKIDELNTQHLLTSYGKKNNIQNTEDILRRKKNNGPENWIRLTLVYFENVTANKVGLIKKCIVDNTNLNNSHIKNIDFAQENIMEIICKFNEKDLVTEELSKLKLYKTTFDPSINDNYEIFKKRMDQIANRKGSNARALKTYARKMSLVTQIELKDIIAKDNGIVGAEQQYTVGKPVNSNE